MPVFIVCPLKALQHIYSICAGFQVLYRSLPGVCHPRKVVYRLVFIVVCHTGVEVLLRVLCVMTTPVDTPET